MRAVIIDRPFYSQLPGSVYKIVGKILRKKLSPILHFRRNLLPGNADFIKRNLALRLDY
jgi:hypothetical protein